MILAAGILGGAALAIASTRADWPQADISNPIGTIRRK